MNKKHYETLKLRVLHTLTQDVLCSSTDDYAIDVYLDDGWQDGTCE